MGNDTDWVAEVRRWCRAGDRGQSLASTGAAQRDAEELGYEAADPALLARRWAELPSDGLNDAA